MVLVHDISPSLQKRRTWFFRSPPTRLLPAFAHQGVQTDNACQADALSNQAIASKYAVEVHSRYSLLQNLDPGDQNIDDACETFKCAVHDSASKILGKPHAAKNVALYLGANPRHYRRSEEQPEYAVKNLKSNH